MANMKDLKEALMNTAGEVADVAKDLATAAGDRARDVANVAGDTAKKLSRIAKLNMELSAERENAEKIYAEIGKLYYEVYRDEPGDFFAQLFKQVDFSQERIVAIQAELVDLKKKEEADFECVVESCEPESESDCDCGCTTSEAEPAITECNCEDCDCPLNATETVDVIEPVIEDEKPPVS